MRLDFLQKLQDQLEDSSTSFKIGLLLGIIVYALLVLIFWPWAIIFALNTLFPVLAINFTFWTWLSVVILNLTYNYKNLYKSKE